MREDVIRLSFDISIHEHALLKAACAEAMIPMKDFLHDLVLRGIEELKKKKIQEKPRGLKASKPRMKSLLAECAKDEI
jgi:hypothetical protein